MNNKDLSIDRKEFLGRGWAMPVELNPQTGRVETVAYEDDIKQSMKIILETAPGERVMRPNFGCGIHEMMFIVLDTTTIERIRSVVEEALVRCEARIEVLSIKVDEDATVRGELKIDIDYRVRKTNQTGNLVFPFYFSEGGSS
jgi:phage baseplate assembly protein W